MATTATVPANGGSSHRWRPGELEDLCRRWRRHKAVLGEAEADDELMQSLQGSGLAVEQAKVEFQHIKRLAIDRRPALGPPGDSLDDLK